MKLADMKQKLDSIPSGQKRAILVEFKAHLLALEHRSRFEVCIASRRPRTMREVPGAAKKEG